MSRIEEDLAKSGLNVADMNVREIDSAARAATNTPYTVAGYIIPYYNLYGKLQPFYRCRLFDYDPKYKQVKDQPNHVYYPRGFQDLALTKDYILITEGEKKAILATKLGFPTCAISGVDSWRNRIIELPKDTELSNAGEDAVSAKLPSGGHTTEDFMSPLATGLQDLIDFSVEHDKTIIIIFDTDNKYGTSHNVQKAAATFGFELRFRGVQYGRIKQLFLPWHPDFEKMGLDDYLMGSETVNFEERVGKVLASKSAFPKHPNTRDYVNKRLQKQKMSRKEVQQISCAILSELDGRGLRLRSKDTNDAYYFDTESHKLLKTAFARNPAEMVDSPFGQYLYKHYGIGAADARLVTWLGSQFTGEEPIEDVTPYRVFARPSKTDDSVLYQINDGQYASVTSGHPNDPKDTPGLQILNNGSDKVLFESDQVVATDPRILRERYSAMAKMWDQNPTIPNWWAETLMDVRLVDKDKARLVTSLLFYISPWLLRWRSSQLPIEMTLGEAGSGKSTLQELRLSIIDGKSKLRNSPNDMKDWNASVASTGGLHITDNVQLADKTIRNHLSDEICRLVTEPNPTIEQRKYYTNADLLSLPVRCVFGITAIKQPFYNADILARSIQIELDKSQDLGPSGAVIYDSNWLGNQLGKHGGREAWQAYHLYVLHRFFKLVKTEWRMNYQAHHRLINFEQSLVLMAKLFGIPKGETWIPAYLGGAANRALTESDWCFEGLLAYASAIQESSSYTHKYRFTAQDIANWAEGQTEFDKCEEITNSRRLGRYLQAHKSTVQGVIGIIEDGKQNNRARYALVLKS